MPQHDVHEAIDKLLLKRRYPQVHDAKDYAVRWMGKSHRKVGHDHQSNLLIAALFYPEDFFGALASGELHDLADRAQAQMKKDLRRALKQLR